MEVNGPTVLLRPEAAQSISLALHELATNAVKHGALAKRDGGKITIAWRLDGKDRSERLLFEWIEKNGELKAPKPSRRGFGMELLTRVLPYDLDAKTRFELQKHGVHFEMDLPGDHLLDGSDRAAR